MDQFHLMLQLLFLNKERFHFNFQVNVVGRPMAVSKSLLQICIIKLNLHAPCNYEVRQVK